MRCPQCRTSESRVTDSRDSDDSIRRRRQCQHCGARFTTYERVEGAMLMVVKRDGRREEFSRDKLLQSIRIASTKRPLPTGALEKAADEIEEQLRLSGQPEVTAQAIGEATMVRLRDLDRVAYIRFASVYRDFDDLHQFRNAIEIEEQALLQAERDGTAQLSFLPNPATPVRRRPRRGRRPSVTPQPALQPAIAPES